jgi:hypothetical protein
MHWTAGRLVTIALYLFAVAAAPARLGDTETELVKRFGSPTSVSKHYIYAQGQMLALGPNYIFRQDDWSISCNVIDGRCMQISYSKPGDWTEEQIQLVLSSNSQGAKWTETSKPGSAKYSRTWKRNDGSTATWQKGSGMSLTWSAYDKAKKAAEERARVQSAIKKPKI